MNYEDLDKETLIKAIMQKDDMLKKLRLEKEKLIYYANTDTMTGVLNRRAGMELLSREFELSKANNRNIVICFVDMDRLKMINDTFGHKEGDKALVNVAKILRDNINKTDFVVRMGGDEFLIVFPETTMKEVNKTWYEICKGVEDANGHSDKYKLSLSYGFYEYSREMQKEMSINDLIIKADEEMYKKKMKKKRDLRIYV